MTEPNYETDLTDEEWAPIEPLLPPEKPIGKRREVDLRVVFNGIFYRADNGIKWRALPLWGLANCVWVLPIVGALGYLGANSYHVGARGAIGSRTSSRTEFIDH